MTEPKPFFIRNYAEFVLLLGAGKPKAMDLMIAIHKKLEKSYPDYCHNKKDIANLSINAQEYPRIRVYYPSWRPTHRGWFTWILWKQWYFTLTNYAEKNAGKKDRMAREVH